MSQRTFGVVNARRAVSFHNIQVSEPNTDFPVAGSAGPPLKRVSLVERSCRRVFDRHDSLLQMLPSSLSSVSGNSGAARAMQQMFHPSRTELSALTTRYGFISRCQEAVMNGLIYLIGLIVVIMAILSFLGLH
jgi:hypothetical protein